MDSGTKSWVLEKYTRLYDPRNSPMTIERGTTDDLSMYVDGDTGRLYVMHNGVAIEDFIMRQGATYPHEVICKDTRILVVIRNQTDGSSIGKFRVRFPSVLLCNSFCATVGGYSRVETYSHWNKDDSMSMSKQDMSYTGVQTDNDADESKQEHKLRAPSVGTRDESVAQPAEEQHRPWAGDGNVVINLHFDTMISDAAMHRFTSMCESIFNRLSGTGPKGGTSKKKKNTKPLTAFVRPLPKKPGERRETSYQLRGTAMKRETPSTMKHEAPSTSIDKSSETI